MERERRVMVLRYVEEPGEFRPQGEYADLAEALAPVDGRADGWAGPLVLLPFEEHAHWPELVRSLASSYDLLFVKALELASGGLDADPESFFADLEARIDRSKTRQG